MKLVANPISRIAIYGGIDVSNPLSDYNIPQLYWEIGKKGWDIKKITKALNESGLIVSNVTIHPNDPSHVVFKCNKT